MLLVRFIFHKRFRLFMRSSSVHGHNHDYYIKMSLRLYAKYICQVNQFHDKPLNFRGKRQQTYASCDASRIYVHDS